MIHILVHFIKFVGVYVVIFGFYEYFHKILYCLLLVVVYIGAQLIVDFVVNDINLITFGLYAIVIRVVFLMVDWVVSITELGLVVELGEYQLLHIYVVVIFDFLSITLIDVNYFSLVISISSNIV